MREEKWLRRRKIGGKAGRQSFIIIFNENLLIVSAAVGKEKLSDANINTVYSSSSHLHAVSDP